MFVSFLCMSNFVTQSVDPWISNFSSAEAPVRETVRKRIGGIENEKTEKIGVARGMIVPCFRFTSMCGGRRFPKERN